MNDSDRIVRQLLQLPTAQVDAIVATWHRERELRDKGAGTSPAFGAEPDPENSVDRAARETAHVGKQGGMPIEERDPRDVNTLRPGDWPRPSSLSSELRELSSRASRAMHLAGREFERLEIRDAKRRAMLEHTQLVPRLTVAAWNAMQAHRSTSPIPPWLVELVDLAREAAGVLLEDLGTGSKP